MKRMPILLSVLIILCSMFVYGCKKPDTAPAASNAPPQPDTQTPSAADNANGKDAIRKVDFKNFTHPAFACNIEDDSDEPETIEKIAVKNGEYRRQNGDDVLYFTAQDAYYGDLDGDGKEEAAVPTVCNLGGSMSFSKTLVYTMRDGNPVLLSQCDYLNEIKMQKGLLMGVVYDKFFKVFGELQIFVLVGNKLIKTELNLSGKTKTESDGKMRLQFESGSTFSVLKGDIKPTEKKVYVLWAKKGQMLSIDFKLNKEEEMQDPRALVEVIGADEEDETKYELGTRHFILLKNGDCEIHLRGYDENPVSYTMTVDIR